MSTEYTHMHITKSLKRISFCKLHMVSFIIQLSINQNSLNISYYDN